MEVPVSLYAVKHYHWIYRGQKQLKLCAYPSTAISYTLNLGIRSRGKEYQGKGWAYISYASTGDEGQKDLKGSDCQQNLLFFVF